MLPCIYPCIFSDLRSLIYGLTEPLAGTSWSKVGGR